jgi:FKBP-type peptidyl-prolyl cis-trans isomerase
MNHVRVVTRAALFAAALCGCHGRAVPPQQSQASAAQPLSADPFAAPADLRGPPTNSERSPSGLRSVVLRKGKGLRKPMPFDRVNIEYSGWTADGQLFASTRKRGAPASLRVDDVVPGWSEGLQLMVEGEQRRLWIPQELAYAGKPGQPQGALVIDLELLAVSPGTPPLAPPSDLGAPPANATRTASGLVHALLSAGSSDARPDPQDHVRIRYAGWNSDGKMIDSSQTQGEIVEVPVGRGFPGWREALALMRLGEKRRFWIPASLNYQQYPGAASGTLVYDIELVQIIDMPAPPLAPRDVAGPPKGAARTATGVAYRVLRKGTGKRTPGPESAVAIHYSCWTTDGVLRDSTIPMGQPRRAELEDRELPPALTEAVQQMVVGEKRRLWAPEGLGFPNKGMPALGMQVFELELLALYEHGSMVESAQPAARR